MHMGSNLIAAKEKKATYQIPWGTAEAAERSAL